MKENLLTLLLYFILIIPFATVAWGLFHITKPMFPENK